MSIPESLHFGSVPEWVSEMDGFRRRYRVVDACIDKKVVLVLQENGIRMELMVSRFSHGKKKENPGVRLYSSRSKCRGRKRNLASGLMQR